MAILWLVVDNTFGYINIVHYNYTSPNFATTGTIYGAGFPIAANITTPFTMSTTDVFTIVYCGLDFM